jgi:glutathione S-transferase
MTAPPILYVFAISHYCEKARWALDHYGLVYRLKSAMPGLNRKITKKLGADSGSLPFLQVGQSVIAGSAAIIDWGEGHRGADKRRLNGDNPAEIAAIEKRLDDITGIHIRRYYYSDALFSDPASVRPIFSRDLPLMQKAAVTLGWSKIVPLMIKGMDLGEAQGRQSCNILAGELDWLDGMLANGRTYLNGDHFTRADLTAASLLAPLVNPAKHPTYAALSLPKKLAQTISDWQDRPVLQWVNAVYDRHR